MFRRPCAAASIVRLRQASRSAYSAVRSTPAGEGESSGNGRANLSKTSRNNPCTKAGDSRRLIASQIRHTTASNTVESIKPPDHHGCPYLAPAVQRLDRSASLSPPPQPGVRSSRVRNRASSSCVSLLFLTMWASSGAVMPSTTLSSRDIRQRRGWPSGAAGSAGTGSYCRPAWSRGALSPPAGGGSS